MSGNIKRTYFEYSIVDVPLFEGQETDLSYIEFLRNKMNLEYGKVLSFRITKKPMEWNRPEAKLHTMVEFYIKRNNYL